jgi:hypothetical protein
MVGVYWKKRINVREHKYWFFQLLLREKVVGFDKLLGSLYGTKVSSSKRARTLTIIWISSNR